MQLQLQRRADIPIYRQIVNQIRDAIQSGALPNGSRLPPVRQVAGDHGLTRLTVHTAYSELQALGLVESHVGRGTFVTAGEIDASLPDHAPPAPWRTHGIMGDLLYTDSSGDVLPFTQAFPAEETYPSAELGRALQEALLEPNALGYGPVGGHPDLRAQIARLLHQRGLDTAGENVLVTSGAQQGIDLALRGLTKPSDVILVEEPVYPGILEVAAQRGQSVVGIPNDGGTLREDVLQRTCHTHHPRLIYLVPAYNNPTGRTLSWASRQAVLRAATEHDLLVLEDDTYGLLGFGDGAVPAMQADDPHGRVIYLSSFSKSLAPAIRLGALVAPATLLAQIAVAKQSSDLVCSGLLQQALAIYLRSGHFSGHLTGIRPLYQERRDAMLRALQQHLPECRWTVPEGGFSLWLTLPEAVDEREFAGAALRQGVGVTPGRAFFPQPGSRGAVRLSFARHSPERIEEGMRRLGMVLRDRLRNQGQMLSLAGNAGPLV